MFDLAFLNHLHNIVPGALMSNGETIITKIMARIINRVFVGCLLLFYLRTSHATLQRNKAMKHCKGMSSNK